MHEAVNEGRCPECGSTEVCRGRAAVNGRPLVIQAATRVQKVFFEVDTYVCLECRHLALRVADKGDISLLASGTEWHKVEA